VAKAIDLYVAFALNQETTLCFFLFQEMIFPPASTQYLVVDVMSMGQPTQYTSNNLRFEYFLCSHTTIPVLDPF